MEDLLCFYYIQCQGEGTQECPHYHRFYCSACATQFKPDITSIWTASVLICPECHRRQNMFPMVPARPTRRKR